MPSHQNPRLSSALTRWLAAALAATSLICVSGPAYARVAPKPAPAREDPAKGMTMKDAAIIAMATPNAPETDLSLAAQTLRVGLKEIKGMRAQSPQLWAMFEQALGAALVRLSVSKSGTAELEEAVSAYRAALEYWTRKRNPERWAEVQADLGAAFGKLGERKDGVAAFRDSVLAYVEALKEITREKNPVEYGRVTNNAANSLLAFADRTRETAPLKWAQTQFNLGDAYFVFGKRTVDPAKLQQSLAAFNEALKEFSHEREPMMWAAVQNGMGLVYREMGDKAIDHREAVTRLADAVADFRRALEVFTPEAAPHDHETVAKNLAQAEGQLALRRKMAGM
ncbi:hypothetical protein [Methylocystis parvus]|uniref:hypothetical protein n=1 Tax=Methylocystis parvus TaxID=134 RepID=UPI003C77137D